MIEIRQTTTFAQWLADLRDIKARTRIAVRLDRLGQGNPGDSRSVGSGVMELRLDLGPGYRLYYVRRGDALIVLLCGGDKSSQPKDVERAKQLAEDL